MPFRIDRSFFNCPNLRHFSKFTLLHFQGLTNGKVIAPVTGARLQRRPDVKNPERSERKSGSENQRSTGCRELNRVETANPIRRSGPVDSSGFARPNVGGSRGGQIFGAI